MEMTEEIDYAKTAWGDESVRMHADPPMYLLGACTFGEGADEGIRDLIKLKPNDSKKLHWRELSPRLHKKTLQAIESIRHNTYLVIASPIVGNKQERARRKCLQTLLMELERSNIDSLILEGRVPNQNKRDIDFQKHLYRSNTLTRIRIKHVQGDKDNRLVVPDLILGAYGSYLTRETEVDSWFQYWKSIEEKITLLEIKP